MRPWHLMGRYGRRTWGGAWTNALVRVCVAGVILVLVAVPTVTLAERADDDIVGPATLEEAGDTVRSAAPDAQLPAGILVTEDGELLWARSPDDARPMASTTKIMTCLLALEHTDPDDRVTVSARAAGVGGSGVYLRAGEELRVADLMLILMMESSNAAATALAEHISGSEAAFVELMNGKARELGLDDTAYRNPHGLDTDGHATSPQDLADLTRLAMQDEEFREIVATERAQVPGPAGDRVLENSNLMVGTYAGATGVKTGWTTPAGYCLVASAERDTIELVCVVLGTGSEDARFVEARRLLDWGFEHYGPVTLASVEETIASVRVSDYLDQSVVARVGEGATANVLDLAGHIRREYEVAVSVESPVDEGDRLGTLAVYQGDQLLAEVPLVAEMAVPEPDLWERVQVFFTRLWESWFGQAEPATVFMDSLRGAVC